MALAVLLRVSIAEILSLFPNNPWGLLQSGVTICIIWDLEKEKESRTPVGIPTDCRIMALSHPCC